MCQSLAQGGRRCASHTRPKFHAAVDAVNTAKTRRAQTEAQVHGLDAVAFHAATPTGKVEVAALLAHAERTGDQTLAGFFRIGQQMAVGVNQAYAEMAADMAAGRSSEDDILN